MKASEIYKMIKEGKKVEVCAISAPLQIVRYEVNGEKVRFDVGEKLIENCPSGVINKPNINMYTTVWACTYN
jgi:hypothetical protein